MDRPRRPALFGPVALDAFPGGADPALREEVATTTARLLVQGARDADDEEVVARLVGLADAEGLEVLASLWADSSPDSLPGALWRLYALRQWVHADPLEASRQFGEGRRRAPVLEAVAGVADPPGPEEVKALADAVLRGVVRGDVATTFERAAAFARVVAVGRASLADDAEPATDHEAAASTRSAVRLVRTAEHLEAAARGVRLDAFGRGPVDGEVERRADAPGPGSPSENARESDDAS